MHKYLLNILNFSLTRNVPFDYMHLILVAALKKTFSLWKSGPKTRGKILPRILHEMNVKKLSTFIDLVNMFTPRDMNRKLSSFDKCQRRSSHFACNFEKHGSCIHQLFDHALCNAIIMFS